MWRYLKFPAWSELDPPTHIRLRSTLSAAADYGLNVIILFAFAGIGTIGMQVPVAILLLAIVLNVVIVYAIASGMTLRLADPSIIGLQVGAACGINLVGLALAPQIAHRFIVNLFVPLSFGSLHFTRRGFLTAWCILAACMTVMILALGERVGIALSRQSEQWLGCTVLVLAFARFLAIHAVVSRLRDRLHKENKELARVSMELAQLVTHDELTGVWNRRQFVQFVQEEINRARRSGSRFTVAIADVDHFAALNDTCGLEAGDAVLQELASLMEQSVRSPDRVGRYGGGTFALMLVDLVRDDLPATMDRLCRTVCSHDWSHLCPGVQLTISIGVAQWRYDESHFQLLNRANGAVLQAKNAGRNQWTDAIDREELQ